MKKILLAITLSLFLAAPLQISAGIEMSPKNRVVLGYTAVPASATASVIFGVCTYYLLKIGYSFYKDLKTAVNNDESKPSLKLASFVGMSLSGQASLVSLYFTLLSTAILGSTVYSIATGKKSIF